MTAVFDVLTQNILPIFVVAALGYWLRRSFFLDKRVLARLAFYALTPSLVFTSLTRSALPTDELGRLALFAAGVILTMGAVGWLAARLLRLDREGTLILMVGLMFVNAGNYGLTLNQLRYGEPGLARAVVYYVVSTCLLYTIGVLLVSAGRQSLRTAAVKLLRLPALYAVVGALIVYSFSLPLPAPLADGIALAGNGAIPVMLIVLGMNLADLRGAADLRLAVPAATIRLVAGPLVAVTIAGVIGLQGLGRATSIIEASMPTAVITTVLATEYDLAPTAMTAVVVVSTLASPLTVATVIAFLGL